MDINSILLDLEIIKQINKDDKLAVQILPGITKLYVQKASFFSPFIRYYYGYNRDNSLKYLDDLVNNIEKAFNYLNEGNLSHSYKNLQTTLTESLKGLENLKESYSNDTNVSSHIILIINNLSKYKLNENKD